MGWQIRPVSQRHVLCALQAVIRTVIGEFKEGETSVIGFKETRHASQHQLDFFRTVFPCARFVLSSRKSMATSDDGLVQMHASRPIDMYHLKLLQNHTRELDLWQEKHPENAFTMRLEDLSVDSANDLLSWLGVKGCQYSQVPHANKAGKHDEDVAHTALQMT